MKPEHILEEQRITLKRGRFNNYGFEPCANAFFDFYLSPKYIEAPPLLELEDVAFFLFLRKNINDTNPNWHMPSIRQMMRRLHISYSKITAMMGRLEEAHLLKKESGYRQGEHGSNTYNDYILSDPIQNLEEFLAIAREGYFPRPCIENRDTRRETENTPDAKNATPPIAEIATFKQTSILNRLEEQDADLPSVKAEDIFSKAWENTLSLLKQHSQGDTFYRFIDGTVLVNVENNLCVLQAPNPAAKEWVKARMAPKLASMLNVELKLLGGPEVDGVRVI